MLSSLSKEHIQIFGKNVTANLNKSANDIVTQCSRGNSKKNYCGKIYYLTSKSTKCLKKIWCHLHPLDI